MNFSEQRVKRMISSSLKTVSLLCPLYRTYEIVDEGIAYIQIFGRIEFMVTRSPVTYPFAHLLVDSTQPSLVLNYLSNFNIKLKFLTLTIVVTFNAQCVILIFKRPYKSLKSITEWLRMVIRGGYHYKPLPPVL